jgi:hypothetical protein
MTDDARAVAFNEAAPPDERQDAMGQLQKAHMPLSSALIPPENLQMVFDHINNGLEDEAYMMAKARSNVILFPGDNRSASKQGMRSVYLDDLQIFTSGEYFEKPNPLGFAGLRTIVEQTPVLNAIILTRIRQINRFCQISEDGGPGFELRHVDRKHKINKSEQETCQTLSRFVANCGWEWNPRKRKMLKRDNFTQFMAKSVRDSLTYDACPIETEMKRNRALGIDGFYAVDGSTIRLCSDHGYEGDDQIFAVQTVEGRLSTTYTLDQMIYEVRNPRSDVRLAGYGLGETELLIRCVTGFLNAMTYNMNGFDQNAIPKGLLHISGDYSTEDLGAFKRYWNMMVKGINNAWTLPVLVSKDQESKASFEKFNADYDEMMFSKWMTFLVSIMCAIYGMGPDEINFESFSADKSSLSGSDTESKLENSKDKGLRPLMSFYESTISDWIIGEFGDQYCFRWVGLDTDDPKQDWEETKLASTWGELRAQRGDAPNPNPDLDSMPLNPSFIGPWQAAQQAKQQQQGDFGSVPGEEGSPVAGGPLPPGNDGPDKPAAGDKPGALPPPSGAPPKGGLNQPAAAKGEDFGKALLTVWKMEV